MSRDAAFDSQFDEHAALLAATREAVRRPFHRLVDLCVQTSRAGGKIVFFGNGGSAADAQHLAAEFTVRFVIDRAPIASLALTTDSSALTAIGNDLGFERLFARQVEALCRAGDTCIGISTSGKSENVIQGLIAAHARGCAAAGLLGGDGGRMAALCDPALVVPSRVTARIQEMHILLGQMLCAAVERELGARMTSVSDLLGVVERFAGLRVGCVGDLMLDRYVHGSVERISPEAPVPVLRVAGESAVPGGAGNVVRNLAALGVSVRFAAAVGADPAGRELEQLLAESCYGVQADLVTEVGRRTTVKTRFLADGQQLLRTDDESTAPLSAASRDALARRIAGWRGTCPVVVLSDYAKGVLAGDTAASLIAAVRAQGARVIVDPKGRDFSRYRDADVLTPNRRELALAAGSAIPPGGEADCARSLRERFRLGAVLVTLGRDGMLLVGGGGGVHELPAQAREVFDVSGAGDTVVAVLAAALAAGAALEDAAALANVAGGIVVGKVGTAVVRRAELASALRQRDRACSEEKVFDLPAMRERVEIWRRQGLRIGFTNGCFDLIHPGHVSLLAQASAACDRLVVGLNTDASVARLKGPGRPVQPETARAAVLASIASVDAVVAFAEDTPLALIEALRPEVLVKGADYALDEVVGADLVRGWGGRVLLARLEPGFSTSKTIAAMTTGGS